jgi:hypothetical protein
MLIGSLIFAAGIGVFRIWSSIRALHSCAFHFMAYRVLLGVEGAPVLHGEPVLRAEGILCPAQAPQVSLLEDSQLAAALRGGPDARTWPDAVR